MTGVSFLIDTDWVIDHLNSLSPATQRLRELEPQGIAINIITVAELWEGVIFSRDRRRSETMLREFAGGADVPFFGMSAIRHRGAYIPTKSIGTYGPPNGCQAVA